MTVIAELENAYKAMEVAASAGWTVTEVDWPVLEKFHQSLRLFESRLQFQQLDDVWRPFLRYCRSFRFFLVATPLPASQIIAQMRGWRKIEGVSLEQLKLHLDDRARTLYSEVLQAFDELQNECENRLCEHAVAELNATGAEGRRVAVLSPDARLSEEIQNHLAKQLNHDILMCMRPVELKHRMIFDELLVFGPAARRFSDGSEFVYAAPRATSLRLYTPVCFPTSVPSPYQLEGSPHQSRDDGGTSALGSFAAATVKRPGHALTCTRSPEEALDQEWMNSLPQLSVPEGVFSDNETEENWDNEPVSAKQVLLGADHAVFLDPDGSVYRIIQERNEGGDTWICSGVEHTDVRDLGAGDVLLFQAEGGGSMVAEIADQLLGENAERYREAQGLWKSKLRTHLVDHSDTYGVLDLLRNEGSSIRTAATVRNWCGSWNIGPGSWMDFQRLLDVIGLRGDRDSIFQATNAIRAAHRKAGFQLATRLLKMMKGQSLGELMRCGVQRFHGADGMTNCKVAYEVVAVLPDQCEVPPNRLNQPFHIH